MINEYWYVRKRNKHKILLDRHCKAHCRDTDITLKTIKNIIRYVAVSPHKITYANFPLKAIFNLKGRPWRGGLAYIYIDMLVPPKKQQLLFDIAVGGDKLKNWNKEQLKN